MGNPIKKALFDYQLHRCRQEWLKQKKYLSDPYEQWIRENESGRIQKLKEKELGMELISLSNFCAMVSEKKVQRLRGWFCVLLTEGEREMPSEQYRRIFDGFQAAGLVYGDEDMYDARTKERYGPWFKPGDSPETLLSFFCYGSQLYLNMQKLWEAVWLYEPSYDLEKCTLRQYFYDFILFYTDFLRRDALGICHIPEILFHAKGQRKVTEDLRKPEAVNENAYWGYEPDYDVCKLASVKRRGDRAVMKHYEYTERVYSAPVYDLPENVDEGHPFISVIIPSKDNVDMLAMCLGSIREKTDFSSYEIIVVDNGSSEENRQRVENMRDQYRFRYLYEPMDFHFSQMCNLGAKHAKGAFYLFLNDDIEVSSPDWMRALAGLAMCQEIGAVGAKLLYPGSDLIQHVGISDIAVGPVHKLHKCHDLQADYYYGRNTVPYNVIGVTAACLAVGKERFLQAGGFPVEAAVAYNDVEFCFNLYELGYRNVVRNDVVLYHHESVSRGDDRMDQKKWERLLLEKAGVYERHPALKNKDPYYNVNLSGYKPQFFCNFLYGYEQNRCYSTLKEVSLKIKEEWRNDCLIINPEHFRIEQKTELSTDESVYRIEGWAYVLGMDNSRYIKHLYLIAEDGKMLEASFWERYRPDVEDILEDQENISLAGFSCKVLQKDLEPGRYRIAMLYKDGCSRQRLYRECEQIFPVP